MLDKVPELKFKKLSKREVASLKTLPKLKENREEEEEARWKPKKESIGTCLCKGDIVLCITYTSEFDPKSGPLIIGPGSRGQFKRLRHQECFCESCGILYKPEIVKKQKE